MSRTGKYILDCDGWNEYGIRRRRYTELTRFAEDGTGGCAGEGDVVSCEDAK